MYGSGNTIDVQFDLVSDRTGNAFTINATMTDQRSANGGFPITFTVSSGDVWVMEKDRGPVGPSPPPPPPAPGDER